MPTPVSGTGCIAAGKTCNTSTIARIIWPKLPWKKPVPHVVIKLLTFLATIPLLIWVTLQVVLRQSSLDTAKNRLGIATDRPPEKPVIWLHAASLGELTSIKPFLLYLARNFPDHLLLITTNNPAALKAARGWADLPMILQTAPLDIPFVVNRFLAYWSPAGFVNIEGEIWPNRFISLAKKQVPSIMLNARLSDRSAKKLSKLGASALGLVHFNQIYAQDACSADHFSTLGIPQDCVRTIPNFKSLVSLPPPDVRMQARYDRCNTLLAASTHEGEEPLILDAFQSLSEQNPNLRLILVPRHPNRVPEVMKFAQDRKLEVGIYGEKSEPEQVTVVDSLGSLQRIYPLAQVTLVGGSLVPDIGGHTPYEPLRAASAIVSGPFHSNFKQEYETLTQADACILSKSGELADALSTAFSLADELAARAQKVYPSAADPTVLFNDIARKVGLS
ncbi:3-deoxy-D-manno-octulosonic acid transferase [Neptunicoccus cionae]|uniref:3-deoxy-D-manno-octulosonic acid transferase n=1 Tax=Neptunicoccus cionae TaxID=2035344 RepID=UPI001666CAD6|nr:glycosyltransferase N-terminal domain-containing protein [Amylibacter cionae]